MSRLPAWFERVSAAAASAPRSGSPSARCRSRRPSGWCATLQRLPFGGGFATEFLARLVTGERSMRYVGSVVSPLDLGAVLLDVGEQTTLDLSRSSSSSR